jgi:sensor c-di-GMP phosphodiesterase-like protein
LVKNLCSSCGDDIGNVLKLTVIAEGAETQAQRDFLRIDSKRQ